MPVQNFGTGGSASVNGSTPTFKAAVGALPSGSNGFASFGYSPFSTSFIASGTHRRFVYFPSRLPNSTLQGLTR